MTYCDSWSPICEQKTNTPHFFTNIIKTENGSLTRGPAEVSLILTKKTWRSSRTTGINKKSTCQLRQELFMLRCAPVQWSWTNRTPGSHQILIFFSLSSTTQCHIVWITPKVAMQHNSFGYSDNPRSRKNLCNSRNFFLLHNSRNLTQHTRLVKS